MNKIHTGYSNLEFNVKTILSFHKELLELTVPEAAGHYRVDDNVIMEIRSDGTRKIRFTPVEALYVEEAMEQLELAYLDAINDSSINPLLLIPCVILDFLCIHPFKDGNGWMSRLLTLLLLYKAGFDAGRYISFEERINNTKGYYYEALYLSSDNWHENSNDYSFFIENFLLTLFTCYKELDKRFATINSKKVSKSARIEATVLNSVLPISKSEICKILPDISPTTVEAVLGKMVKTGSIIKVGLGRNLHYIRKI